MITRTTDLQAGVKKYKEDQKAHFLRFQKIQKKKHPKVSENADYVADMGAFERELFNL